MPSKTIRIVVPSEDGNAAYAPLSASAKQDAADAAGARGMERMVTSLRKRFGPPVASLEIDTTPLFTAAGEKRGFGSSAVAAVLLTALWLRVAARGGPAGDGDPSAALGLPELLQPAVAAHRAFQGGHGSGYDVAASLFGGVISFSGGDVPEVTALSLPWLPPVALFAGGAPVKTPGAVTRYREWKKEHPDKAERFLRQSNDLVRGFAAARGWEEAAEILARYTALTIELGDQINTPARITPPADSSRSGERTVWKAVGAGDELGILIGTDEANALPTAQEGLQWQ
jgi:phosphomevalonate kinase